MHRSLLAIRLAGQSGPRDSRLRRRQGEADRLHVPSGDERPLESHRGEPHLGIEGDDLRLRRFGGRYDPEPKPDEAPLPGDREGGHEKPTGRRRLLPVHDVLHLQRKGTGHLERRPPPGHLGPRAVRLRRDDGEPSHDNLSLDRSHAAFGIRRGGISGAQNRRERKSRPVRP